MAAVNDQKFRDELERWSGMILNLGLAEKWVDGAIYPCEMVFFLATCAREEVKTVIESGRQDGYSTEILGEFAKQTGTRIVSIDIEFDRERGERCRRRLAHLPIEMVIGDAFEEAGKHVMAEQRPTALLLDGPKSWGAMSILSAAATWKQVIVVAVHNLDVGYLTRDFMLSKIPDIFFEDVLGDFSSLPKFSELWDREIANTLARRTIGTGRESSLGVITIDERNRYAVSHLEHKGFRTYPPSFVRWAWNAKAFGVLKANFRLTNRFLGPEKY